MGNEADPGSRCCPRGTNRRARRTGRSGRKARQAEPGDACGVAQSPDDRLGKPECLQGAQGQGGGRASESVMTMPSTGPAKVRPAVHQRAMATVKVMQARTKALLTMFLMAESFLQPDLLLDGRGVLARGDDGFAVIEYQLQPGVQVGAKRPHVVEVHDERFRGPHELGAGEGLFQLVEAQRALQHAVAAVEEGAAVDRFPRTALPTVPR